MPTISVLNTTANVSGKTWAICENPQTISGLWSFQRSPSAPFGVQAGSAMVSNLDAEKVGGVLGSALMPKAGGTFVGDVLFTDALYDIGKLGATRPRDGFFSRNFVIGGTLTLGGNILSNLLFTDATFDIGAAGATRPRDMHLSRDIILGRILDLSAAAAGQIKFPAAQNASADANTLDDYEEGSWTPVLGGSGGTSGQAYSVQVGRYVKIGRLVIAQFTATLLTEGTITTNLQIQGLPFTAENLANLFSTATLVYASLAVNYANLAARVVPNTTTADVFGATGAVAAMTNLGAADVNNTTSLQGTLIYRAE